MKARALKFNRMAHDVACEDLPIIVNLSAAARPDPAPLSCPALRPSPRPLAALALPSHPSFPPFLRSPARLPSSPWTELPG
ncbi:hypothetical protein Mapa_006145 [Marchantia paleacea]|nr:hypothetical protein Mapa_006145 [Marchantia paleacea]